MLPRGQQLVARRAGRVVHRAGVILAVAQQVAAPVEFGHHLHGDFILTLVHRIYPECLRCGPAAPHGEELVALGEHAGPAAATGLGVAAGPAHR
jgi:hypothetical protein